MTDDDKKALGVLALLLLWASSRRGGGSGRGSAGHTPDGRIIIDTGEDSRMVMWWPLASIDYNGERFNADVSSAGKWTNRDRPTHNGVDVMFARRPPAPGYVKGDHGTPGWWVPDGTRVLAAAGGKVWSVERTARGVGVVIDHGRLLIPVKGGGSVAIAATYYQHLNDDAALIAPVGTKRGKLPNGAPAPTVDPGQPLGTAGYSGEDPGRVRHLHFEVWKGAGTATALDPTQLLMERWGRVMTPPAPADSPE